MKKLRMVLPLALLLAYCSGPNNTQRTNTETNTDATASTTTTVSDETVTASTDVSDVNTNTATVTETTIHTDRTVANSNVSVDHSSSVISPLPSDTTDPMYQHWQRTNAQYWTWDYDYPGFDRPTAGSYNTAINGDWQLVMTPELVTAWRVDDSRALWLRNGNTYLSASETFNTRNNINGLNNNASSNSTTANTMNGSITGTIDMNSINYNAYNGNMYQMPQFNLYLDNASFTGYTGCNGISGRVEVSGTSLRFLNTAPSTAIDCMGGFNETTLLDILKRVDSYAYVGEELQLMHGNEVLLRFRKNSQETTLK